MRFAVWLSFVCLTFVNVGQGRYTHGSDRVEDDQVPDVSDDPYVFRAESKPTNPRYLPSVGNGHLATNVYGNTIYLNGVYNGYLGYSYRARIPALHASTLSVAGVAEEDTQRQYQLDVKRGVFEELILTPEVSVTYRTYAHLFFNRVLVTEVYLERLAGSDDITVNRQDISGGLYSGDITFGSDPSYDCGIGTSCTQVSGQTNVPETDNSGQTPVHMFWKNMPLTFTLAGTSVNNTWVYLMSLDQDQEIARTDFDAALAYVTADNYPEMLDNHTKAWSDVWSQGHIDVEGDLQLNKIIKGSFYYLYSNLPSINTNQPNHLFYGLSPGGLANGKNGSDYYGHVFWDMETWMYPAILMFRPDLAKEMLSYRIHGMAPAFERSYSDGYSGTRFPWESGYTGVEVTPDVCVPCRENQQHITGDIAFAARQYVAATRDYDWLTTPQADTTFTGFEFIYNMAKFWFSRPTLNTDSKRFDINGVMPPDEHAISVNNSIYTNTIASLAIQFAPYAACLSDVDLGQNHFNHWMLVANEVYFTYNHALRYHEEYQGWQERVEANLTGPQTVKQADVVLMGFPLLWEMPDDVRRNDLTHYEAVTTPMGPAMTWGMFSVGWLDMEETDRADEFFQRSYDLYTREPFKIWTEAQEGLGAINFITGMGGFLQAIISGYGGMRLQLEELHFKKPNLLPNVTAMTFTNLEYLGTHFDLEIDLDVVVFTVVDLGQLPLVLHLWADDVEHVLVERETYVFAHQNYTLWSTEATNCTLPADSIDVDYSVSGDGAVCGDGQCTTATELAPPVTPSVDSTGTSVLGSEGNLILLLTLALTLCR